MLIGKHVVAYTKVSTSTFLSDIYATDKQNGWNRMMVNFKV